MCRSAKSCQPVHITVLVSAPRELLGLWRVPLTQRHTYLEQLLHCCITSEPRCGTANSLPVNSGTALVQALATCGKVCLLAAISEERWGGGRADQFWHRLRHVCQISTRPCSQGVLRDEREREREGMDLKVRGPHGTGMGLTIHIITAKAALIDA